MYIFFDTETSGLPRNWSAPASEVDNWPRLVQIAWLCCDQEGEATESREYLLKPQGFKISRKATELHGITTERALREGVDLAPVLDQLSEAARRSRIVVGHNLDFDVKIVQAEWIRVGKKNAFARKRQYCTMKAATDYCQIPGRYGYKWPKLHELHTKLFGHGFDGAHGALADAEACMRCFFRLQELGIVQGVP
jgi:DNA polymerase III epsilon subunit-like protein